ncbi:MAG: hypothetical protein H0U98_09075 [Alphaproteobacteria bacterium]|nr:hypothetical protein [Alphaproteobacteria bacterium]
MRAAATALALLVCAAAASAQPAPTESVTVTGLKDAPQLVVNHFVQAFAAPSYLTGKMARWERGVCPMTQGLAPKFAAFVSERVRSLAAQVNAPVDKDAKCRPNIEIAFTTAPQALLDVVRKDHKNYLGYVSTPAGADALAVVKHKIQAWYMTATKDLDGEEDVDSSTQVPIPIRMPCPTCNPPYIDMYISGGAKKVTGGRLKDGLRTVFRHVFIVADPTKLTDYEMGTLADYIAMLALTQLGSLDVCQQQLPSIINLLAKDCAGAPNQLSESDLGYLRGLYAMSADGNLRVQQDGIAHQMKRNFKDQ